MKGFLEGPAATFSNDLLTDVAFIKKHLRYPFRRMTLMPLVSSGLLIGVFLRVLLVGNTSGTIHLGQLLMLLFSCLPVFILSKRYFDLIRFIPVQTGKSSGENTMVLEQFLADQQLLFSRHPQVDEIFMIVSKNLDRLKDEREILIFLADDNRILINSHFTSSRNRFQFFLSPTHHAQMATQLRQWLETRKTPTGRFPATFH